MFNTCVHVYVRKYIYIYIYASVFKTYNKYIYTGNVNIINLMCTQQPTSSKTEENSFKLIFQQ